MLSSHANRCLRILRRRSAVNALRRRQGLLCAETPQPRLRRAERTCARCLECDAPGWSTTVPWRRYDAPELLNFCDDIALRVRMRQARCGQPTVSTDESTRPDTCAPELRTGPSTASARLSILLFYRLFPETTEYMQCTGSQQKESLAAAAAGTRPRPAARKLPGPCVRDHGRQDTIKEHGTNSSPWKFHLSGACATPELLTQLRLRGNPLRAPTHSHTRYLLW